MRVKMLVHEPTPQCKARHRWKFGGLVHLVLLLAPCHPPPPLSPLLPDHFGFELHGRRPNVGVQRVAHAKRGVRVVEEPQVLCFAVVHRARDLPFMLSKRKICEQVKEKARRCEHGGED